MSSIVALILDPNFGNQLHALAQRMPVWIVSSQLNDSAVAVLRSKLAEGWLTTFLKRPNESATDTLARALIAIDEHHGAESGATPYHAIEVYGVNELPSDDLREELGFRTVVATERGFTAQK